MEVTQPNSKAVTKIKLIRKDSKGIEGTIIAANDHAEALLPLIDLFKAKVMELGFGVWAQSNTMHELVTVNGDRYTLRGVKRDGQYVGVRLALRMSRSVEIRLMDVENTKDAQTLLKTLELLARYNTTQRARVTDSHQ